MPSTIDFAKNDDLDYLKKVDVNINEPFIKRSFVNKEYIIAKIEEEHVGYLRFEFFWSIHPFISVMRISTQHQRKGIGSSILSFLENHLRKQEYKYLISSSDCNIGINWHKKNNFKEIGKLTFPEQEEKEIFFVKNL